MKKLALLAIVAAFAASAFAALEFSSARAVPVLAPQYVSSGATNSAAIVVRGFKGTSELIVYATDAAQRTALDVCLWATNRAEGGWTPYAVGKFTATNNCLGRLTFPGEYLPQDVKVTVGSIGAASTVSAFILTY